MVGGQVENLKKERGELRSTESPKHRGREKGRKPDNLKKR